MHAHDLLIDDGSHGEAVKAIDESLPKLDVVSSLTLIVESVDPVNRRTLVVSAEDEEVLGVLNFVRQEQTDRLHGLNGSEKIRGGAEKV